MVGAQLVSKREIFLTWSHFHQADWIYKDLVRIIMLFHGHTSFEVCCDFIQQGTYHIVTVLSNSLILQLLLVSVLMEAFFLLKRHEKLDKKYPISSRKVVCMDKKHPPYNAKSSFDSICVETYVFY